MPQHTQEARERRRKALEEFGSVDRRRSALSEFDELHDPRARRSRAQIEYIDQSDQDVDESMETERGSRFQRYGRQVLGSLVRGAGQVVSAIPKAASAFRKDRQLPDEGPTYGEEGFQPRTHEEVKELFEARREADPLTERPFYKIGTAIDDFLLENTPESDPELEESFWLTKVPQGLGSSLGFLGAGLGVSLSRAVLTRSTLAASKGVGGVTAAGLGGTVGAASQYEDALRHGADESTARTALQQGVGPGLLEGLPVMRTIARFTPSGGGAIQRLLMEGGKGSVEEAIQEALQTVGSNAIAADLYDKDRALSEGVLEAALVGGTVGGATNFLATFVGSMSGEATTEEADPWAVLGMKRSADLEEVQEVFQDRLAHLGIQIEADEEGNVIWHGNQDPKAMTTARNMFMALQEVSDALAEAEEEAQAEAEQVEEAEVVEEPEEEVVEKPEPEPEAEPEPEPEPEPEETEETPVEPEEAPEETIEAEPETPAVIEEPLGERGERKSRTEVTVTEVIEEPVEEGKPTRRQEKSRKAFEEEYEDGSKVTRNEAGEVLEEKRPGPEAYGVGTKAYLRQTENQLLDMKGNRTQALPQGTEGTIGAQGEAEVTLRVEGVGDVDVPADKLTKIPGDAQQEREGQGTLGITPEAQAPPTFFQRGQKAQVLKRTGFQTKWSESDVDVPLKKKTTVPKGVVTVRQFLDDDMVQVSWFTASGQPRMGAVPVAALSTTETVTEGPPSPQPAPPPSNPLEKAVATYDTILREKTAELTAGKGYRRVRDDLRYLADADGAALKRVRSVMESEKTLPFSLRQNFKEILDILDRAYAETYGEKDAELPSDRTVPAERPQPEDGEQPADDEAEASEDREGDDGAGRVPGEPGETREGSAGRADEAADEPGDTGEPGGDDGERGGDRAGAAPGDVTTEPEPEPKPEKPKPDPLKRLDIAERSDEDQVKEFAEAFFHLETDEVNAKDFMEEAANLLREAERLGVAAKYGEAMEQAADAIREEDPSLAKSKMAEALNRYLYTPKGGRKVLSYYATKLTEHRAEEKVRRFAREGPASGDLDAEDFVDFDPDIDEDFKLDEEEEAEAIAAIPDHIRESMDEQTDRPIPEPGTIVGSNFPLTTDMLGDLGGPKTRTKQNIAAILLAKKLRDEQRDATRDEQEVLVKFVGWGGLKALFNTRAAHDWKPYQKELKEVLTPEEYETAERSTQYAHYTSLPVVNAMYGAVERMGVAGRVHAVEPAAGIGHFLGLSPFRGTWTAVEMDKLTGEVLSHLYPEARTEIKSYQDLDLPSDAYDLVMGNPPFASTRLRHAGSGRKHVMHDYFIIKSLDRLRPGGILAMVTSTGTMDKLPEHSREAMAQRADFLGAVRLPSSAFEKNAATSVTTDIVFFQRRAPDAQPSHRGDWMGTEIVEREVNGQKLKLKANEYFLKNPQMVLGTLTRKTLWADSRVEEKDLNKVYDSAVAPSEELQNVEPENRPTVMAQHLAVALRRLPNDIYAPHYTARPDAMVQDELGDVQPGQWVVKRRGKREVIFTREGDRMVAIKALNEIMTESGNVSAPRKAKLERMVWLTKLNDAAKDVLDANRDWEGAANLKKAQAKLTKLYDGFVDKYGPVNKEEETTRRLVLTKNTSVGDKVVVVKDHKGIDSGATAEITAVDGTNVTIVDDETGTQVTLKKKELRRDVNQTQYPNLKGYASTARARVQSLDWLNHRTGEYEKADIFTKRLLGTRPQVTKVDDAWQGVAESLRVSSEVDMKLVRRLTGKTEGQIVRDLEGQLFLDPLTNQYLARHQYITGNVREKLAIAQEAVARNPQFKSNVEHLEKVIPDYISAPVIRRAGGSRLGGNWIPTRLYEQFARGVLGIRLNIVRRSIDGKYSVTQNTTVDARTYTNRAVVAEASYEAFSVLAPEGVAIRGGNANQIFKAVLNGRAATVKNRVSYIDDEGKSRTKWVFHPELSDEARRLAEIMQVRFEHWLMRDDATRATQMADLWNIEMNHSIAPEFDGSFLEGHINGLTESFRGQPFQFRPHQLNAIWRIVSDGNTLLQHSTGSGKTFVMAGAAMLGKQMGVFRKPMIVVPNAIVEQFAGEFLEIFPDANVLVGGTDNFAPANRKKFLTDVASNDWDAVIIKQSQFGELPTTPETTAQFYRDFIAEYRFALVQAREEGAPPYTVSKIQEMIEKFEQKVRDLLSQEVDKTDVFFEDLGVDQLFVDEAHDYKNLALPSFQLKEVKESQRAMKLFLMTRHMDRQTPGRGVVLSTATPISNEVGELYKMLRYLDERGLRDQGWGTLDAWANDFVGSWEEYEYNDVGELVLILRPRAYANPHSLSLMWRQKVDIIHDEDLPFKLPDIIDENGEIQGEPTMVVVNAGTDRPDARLTRLMLHNLERWERLKGMNKAQRDADPDSYFRIMWDGRKASVDARMVVSPEALVALDNSEAFHRSKVEVATERISKFLDDTKEHRATAMVFAGFGVEGNGYHGYSFYDDLKTSLLEQKDADGRPILRSSEIAFIRDAAGNQMLKQEMLERMNRGEIRVMLGQVKNLGTGVNAQRRLGYLLQIDAPWKPSEVQQIEGRIIRQGNKLFDEGKIKGVRVERMVLQGSYDTKLWQILENKIKPVEQLLNATPTTPMIAVGSDGITTGDIYAMVKAGAAPNPHATDREMWRAKRDRLVGARDRHEERTALQQRARVHKEQLVEDLTEDLRWTQIDAETVQSELPEKDTFKATIDNKVFTKPKDASVAIEKILNRLGTDRHGKPRGGTHEEVVGTYAGLPIKVAYERYFGEGQYRVSLVGTTKSGQRRFDREKRVYIEDTRSREVEYLSTSSPQAAWKSRPENMARALYRIAQRVLAEPERVQRWKANAERDAKQLEEGADVEFREQAELDEATERADHFNQLFQQFDPAAADEDGEETARAEEPAGAINDPKRTAINEVYEAKARRTFGSMEKQVEVASGIAERLGRLASFGNTITMAEETAAQGAHWWQNADPAHPEVRAALVSGIAKPFHAWVDVRGQRIESTEDAYRILREFARSKTNEIYHFIGTDADGKVVFHEALSSGAINYVSFGTQHHDKLRFLVEKYGASNVYLAHNHPSGIAVPSDADIALAEAFGETVGDLATVHSLVINSNHFSTYGANRESVDTKHTGREIEPDYAVVNTVDDAANLFTKYVGNQQGARIMYTDAANQVVAIDAVGEYAPSREEVEARTDELGAFSAVVGVFGPEAVNLTADHLEAQEVTDPERSVAGTVTAIVDINPAGRWFRRKKDVRELKDTVPKQGRHMRTKRFAREVFGARERMQNRMQELYREAFDGSRQMLDDASATRQARRESLQTRRDELLAEAQARYDEAYAPVSEGYRSGTTDFKAFRAEARKVGDSRDAEEARIRKLFDEENDAAYQQYLDDMTAAEVHRGDRLREREDLQARRRALDDEFGDFASRMGTERREQREEDMRRTMDEFEEMLRRLREASRGFRQSLAPKSSKPSHEVLGVASSASDAEVKKSYRKLAMQLHPDQSGSPETVDQFMEVHQAYVELGAQRGWTAREIVEGLEGQTWEAREGQTEHGDWRKPGEDSKSKAERLEDAYNMLDAFRGGLDDVEVVTPALREEALTLLTLTMTPTRVQDLVENVAKAQKVGDLKRAISSARVAYMHQLRDYATRDFKQALAAAKVSTMHPDFVKQLRAVLHGYNMKPVASADARRKLLVRGKQNIRYLKLDQIRELTRQVLAIAHGHTAHKKLVGERRGQLVTQIEDAIVVDVKGVKLLDRQHLPGRFTSLWSGSAKRQGTRTRNWAISDFFAPRPADMMHILSPALREVVYDDVSVTAYDRELKLLQSFIHPVITAAEKASGQRIHTRAFEKWRSEPFELSSADPPKLKDGTSPRTPDPVEITKDEAIQLYLTLLDPTNKGLAYRHGVRIRANGRQLYIGKEVHRNIEAIAGEDGVQIAKAMFDLFNGSMKDEINKAWVDVYGYEIANVVSYVPRKIDPRDADPKGEVKQDDPLDLMAQGRDPGIASWGHLKKRIGTNKPLLIGGAMSGFNHHASHVARISAYLAPAHNAHTILTLSRESIEDRIGEHGFNRLRESVRLQTTKYYDKHQVEKVTRKLMRNAAVGILALRPSTWFLNPAGLAITAGHESALGNPGFKWLAKAITTRNDPREWKRIVSLAKRISPYWEARYGKGFINEITAGLTGESHYSFGPPTIGELGLIPLQVSDQFGAVIRWKMAEIKIAELQPKLEEGSKAFLDQVNLEWMRMMFAGENTSHGGDLTGALAVGRRNVFFGTMTMFQSSVSKIYSLAWMAGQLAAKQKKAAAVAGLTGVAVSLAYAVGIRILKDMLDGDEEPPDAGDMARRFFIEATGTVPIAGSVVQPIVNDMYGEGGRFYQPSQLVSIFEETVGTGRQGIDTFRSLVEGEVNSMGEAMWPGEAQRFAENMMGTASKVMGFPWDGPKDMLKWVMAGAGDPSLRSELQGDRIDASQENYRLFGGIQDFDQREFRQALEDLTEKKGKLTAGEVLAILNRRPDMSYLTKYEPGKPDRALLNPLQREQIDAQLDYRDQLRQTTETLTDMNRDLLESDEQEGRGRRPRRQRQSRPRRQRRE